MRKIIIFLMMFMFICGLCFAEKYVLTDKQIQYMDLISKSIKNKYPTFGGFDTENKVLVNVYGIDYTTCEQEIKTADIETLKHNDNRRKDLKQVRQKLKALGLDNKDLKIMGLDNDIDD